MRLDASSKAYSSLLSTQMAQPDYPVLFFFLSLPVVIIITSSGGS